MEAWPPEERERRGYVLWDESWHEGVIGIVASRLVERFHRPVVLIARAGDDWKGSGRSISDFDLHGGLAACAEHLGRFGGHRAAAGLSITTENLEPFRAAFAEHASAQLRRRGADRPVTAIDAIVPAGSLTLELAQELDRLAPFGLGNPEPTLLVASVEAIGARPWARGGICGSESGSTRQDGGSAIAFGLGLQLDRLLAVGQFDIAFRLKENRWNGTTAPQLVVRRVFDAAETYAELRAWLAEPVAGGGERVEPGRPADLHELGLDGTGVKRQLLESESFRALLGCQGRSSRWLPETGAGASRGVAADYASPS